MTVSNFPEVDTWQLIREGWNQGKRITTPKCIPASKEMVFRQIQGFNELESAYFGLFEPIEQMTDEVVKDDIDLLIVPGLIFNRKGFRVGFGGGYYDRYLKGYEGATLSLAFSMQLRDQIPVESHDIPVGKIITEAAIIDCSM